MSEDFSRFVIGLLIIVVLTVIIVWDHKVTKREKKAQKESEGK